LTPNYNLFDESIFGPNLFVPKGTLIRVTLTTGAEIFVDRTNKFSDCMISGSSCTKINAGQDFAMLVQMSITPIRKI